MEGGQPGESFYRIIRHMLTDHYHLAGWALCPYLPELEGHDECASVYFRPVQLLSEYVGGRSLDADG